MKRIAIVVENYYPAVSGVPVVMQYLAEGLVKAGYTVEVHTCGVVNGERFERNSSHNGVKINRYYIKNSRFNNVVEEYGEKERLINNVCSENIDCAIITCSQCCTTNVLLPELNNIKGKTVFYTHGYSGLSFCVDFKNGFKRFLGSIYRVIWAKNYYRKLPTYLKQFDSIVYISQNDSAKEFDEEHGIEFGVVIDNAVEDCFFEDGYTEHSKKKYLLNVSNYTVVKNQEKLLEAFYRADTADFSMILIGSTETGYTKRLYQLQKKYEAVYGEKNVSILYGVEREKIHEYVRDATIFVMSSTWEQYSIALCEAMAEGVPFISTDVGNASFLPGGVIANTVDEIATAMTTLLSNLDAAKKLGLRGKEYAYAHNKREVAIQSLIEVIEQERRNKKR